MESRRDAFTLLRETLRWRVAFVLGLLIMALMFTLGVLNTRLGLRDTAFLAWIIFTVTSGCVIAMILLPRRTGSTIFFVTVAVLLVAVPMFGLYHARNMQHWAYIFPPLLVLLMRSRWALMGMVLYGLYVALITLQLLPTIEVVRFACGYGLLVCFIYTYALLEERAVEMLRYLSDHDALSNCLNRRTFNEAIEQLGGDQAGTTCTFLLIDIDHFKSINDQHGHLVGDRVITEVASTLGKALSGAQLYRYGGEEFAVIVPTALEADGIRWAETLRHSIAEGTFQGIKVGVSIGVASWRRELESVSAAVGRADRALYAAKRAGRNCVVGDSSAPAA